MIIERILVGIILEARQLMNPVISNLPLIWGAAEYFDKQCGSKWALQKFFHNAFVWSAFSVLSARKSGDERKELAAITRLSTLRTWIDDLSRVGISLELDRLVVEKTLGVNHEVDAHTEACAIARKHCMRARAATDFRRYYFNAIDMITEREEFKRLSVAEVIKLLEKRESTSPDTGEIVLDADRYDVRSIERDIDMLHETVAKVVESLDVECRAQLKGATSSAIKDRLSAYLEKIHEMGAVVGVDLAGISDRQVDLNAEIEEQMRLLREG